MRVFILTSLLLFLSSSLASGLPVPFVQLQNQHYFESPEIMIDSEEYDTIILNLEAKESGTARLFWANSYDPQFNQPKSIWFSIRSGKHSYYFNLPSQNQYWLGWVRKFLIYPETEAKIASAEIIKGNLFTNLASGWQEFWGPRGRLIIGSTINTIQSSNLFGHSIFVYIYWSIAFIILGRFAIKRDFLDAGKTAFLCIIIFWGLLETSSWYNNWLLFKSDLRFVGKSQEEKSKMANTGDFYSFIQFCEKHLPLDAKFDLRIQLIYGNIKANYYLYPRKYEKEAEYVLVYDTIVEGQLMNKYSIWQKFRNGAYILRKG